MGTRCSTFFYNDGYLEPAVAIHRQFDGYPRVHGADLYDFLAKVARAPELPDARVMGKTFLRDINLLSMQGRPILEEIEPTIMGHIQEWNYWVYVREGGKVAITVSRNGETAFHGELAGFRDYVDSFGSHDLEPLPTKVTKAETELVPETKIAEVKEDELPDGDYGVWESPDPTICESVELKRRNEWAKELTIEMAKDPTVSFMGSGDRTMIATVDDINDGYVSFTIEDCIITRRKHMKVKCQTPPDTSEMVKKSEVHDVLLDLRTHLSMLDKLPATSINSWKKSMKEWLDELEQLTLTEPK